MKYTILIMVALGLLSCKNETQQTETPQAETQKAATHEQHSTPSDTSAAPKSLSPHTSAMAMINGAHIHIDYSAPSVRDRIIFGGLVGYNTVWQAGAHKATWIETDKDLLIDGKTLKAGKYGFFVIPGEQQWEVMFNSRWDQHGKDEYNATENILTLQVTPEKLDETQETLAYEVIEVDDNAGKIVLAWEKVKIEIPFKVVN